MHTIPALKHSVGDSCMTGGFATSAIFDGPGAALTKYSRRGRSKPIRRRYCVRRSTA